MDANGHTSESPFVGAWYRLRHVPTRVESGLKTHPFTTVTVIAGISFVAGMVLGSRVARSVLVAIAPAVAQRLLDGPLGEDLDRYIGGALPSPSATSRTASRKGGEP